MSLIDRMNEITHRTRGGFDCTEDDSVFILSFFDAYDPETTEEGRIIAQAWPLEFDQWCREKEGGHRS